MKPLFISMLIAVALLFWYADSDARDRPTATDRAAQDHYNGSRA